MTKVVMLGISGLDADLLRVYGPSLPNVRRLLLHSPFLEMRSCFPPEPVPAWTSVYTGLHPANHGIITSDTLCTCPDSSDEYLTRDGRAYMQRSSAASLPVVETFWRAASRAGKRVCIVHPLPTIPTEKVNGIIQAQPCDALEVKQTATTIGSSIRRLETFCDELQTRTWLQAEQALELYHRKPWDLFFVQWDALDAAQHFLWRYSDPGDPTYPGRNEYAGRILEFYRLFDEIIERFQRAIPGDCVLLVASAHGHGRGCVYRLHLNEWLRGQGLLIAHERLQGALPRLARHLPGSRNAHQSLASIDMQASVARLVELAGTSPYGGIALNRDVLARGSDSYRRARAALIEKLLHLQIKGNPVVNWAKTREELYEGPFTIRYPDIVFELRGDFGVASDLFVPLVTSNRAHRVMSGGHTPQGVLLMDHIPAPMDIQAGIQEPTTMDVAPTVLHLLGLAGGEHDGASLVSPQRVTQLI